MGCCNSTEKAPKTIVEKPKVSVADDVPKVVVAVQQEEQPQQQQQQVQSRLSKIRELSSGAYRYNRSTVLDGICSPILPNGICYRIIRDGTCFFYNDSLQYEVHVHCQFPPTVSFTPSSETRVMSIEHGWRDVYAVIYPLETVEFGTGDMNVCKTDASAQPLSKTYLSRLEILTQEALRHIDTVRGYARGSKDEEATLRKCIETNTPYVDLNFLPSERMFSRANIDGRIIAASELRRPHERGLDAGDVDAIRGDIIPHCIDRGLLGDSWFTCAAAILAENAELVKEIFAQTRPEEKALGAYRVALNKNGWWNSVIVDDFLPTVNGMPCYARSLDDPTELWVSLLQKAYAKLHGSYASITGGDALHALQDFSGAPTMRFDKEWADAVRGRAAEQRSFADRLIQYTEEGHAIVLNTAATDETGAYAAAGLYCGFTYLVEAVRHFSGAGVTLLKLRNPWGAAARYGGPWSARCPNWDSYPEVRDACRPAAAEGEAEGDGSFWMEWAQAAEFFVGGGVVFLPTNGGAYDYRVQGEFRDACPNVVFAVKAVEQVEVIITLSQKDKRGVSLAENDAALSPIMLSVSRGEGNKQRVDLNSSSNPESPSGNYTFIVGRDVAMRYRFEPRDEPYFVIPRILCNEEESGLRKAFVVGMRSSTPLEGKLDIRFTKIEETNRVFRNDVTFVVEGTADAFRTFQKKSPGAAAVTDSGVKLSEATIEPEFDTRELGQDANNEEQEKTPVSRDKTPKSEDLEEMVKDKINTEAEKINLKADTHDLDDISNAISNGVAIENNEGDNDHDSTREL